MHNSQNKQRDHHNMLLTPSFSSTLLDQIYRSIDTKTAETNFYTHTTIRHTTANSKSTPTDTKSFAAKSDRKSRPADVDILDQDALFFSSTSISSDSSFGFSSDTESLSRASCFAPRPRPRPKLKPRPVSASTSFRSDKHGMRVFDAFCRNSHTSEEQQQQQQRRNEEALMIKSKSRALKIYNNLKKVKQPISPGGRVTSFLNSLFANAKKTTPRTCRAEVGTCSSASASSYYSGTCDSSSRSCLSKTLTSEREALRDGVKRTVRFYPVSVIVGEDSRPCGHKRLGEEKQPSRDFLRYTHKKRNNDLVFKDLSFSVHDDDVDDHDDDDDDDDASSYASSDLFELDHLAMFGSARYCEELPVYETTHVSTNRAIANGLIV